MSEPTTRPPNPKRVAAGKRNRQRWKGFTEDGLDRLQQSALANRPWTSSTGPRTAKGKTRSTANNKKQQLGPKSVREIREEVRGLRQLLGAMRRAASAAAG
jgi:hypothetical protein